jgi:phosphatidylglycerophosphate synthase
LVAGKLKSLFHDTFISAASKTDIVDVEPNFRAAPRVGEIELNDERHPLFGRLGFVFSQGADILDGHLARRGRNVATHTQRAGVV